MVCPICDVESDNNHSCSNCNWEFIYFSEEPTYQQKIEYNEMMFLYAKNIAEFLIQQNEPYDFFVAKALTFKPDIDLYLALINFYVEKQEFDFALELALESLKLTPCPMAYFAVAACYATLGQYTTALEYAKKAIEFDPTLPMDYIFGNIYRGLNQQNKAIEHYEKYLLTINPNDEDIKKYVKDSKAQVNPSNKIQDDKIQKVNTVQVEEVPKKEEIIKLTPKILEKNQFETDEEFRNKINNLGWVEIGEAELIEYNTETNIFNIKCNVYKDLENVIPTWFKEYFTILKMDRDKAKNLYTISKKHPILLKLILNQDNKVNIKDIKIVEINCYNLAFIKNSFLYLVYCLSNHSIANSVYDIRKYKNDDNSFKNQLLNSGNVNNLIEQVIKDVKQAITYCKKQMMSNAFFMSILAFPEINEHRKYIKELREIESELIKLKDIPLFG
jgi:tetratricopeptide (TPR) repeat protein